MSVYIWSVQIKASLIYGWMQDLTARGHLTGYFGNGTGWHPESIVLFIKRNTFYRHRKWRNCERQFFRSDWIKLSRTSTSFLCLYFVQDSFFIPIQKSEKHKKNISKRAIVIIYKNYTQKLCNYNINSKRRTWDFTEIL